MFLLKQLHVGFIQPLRKDASAEEVWNKFTKTAWFSVLVTQMITSVTECHAVSCIDL